MSGALTQVGPILAEAAAAVGGSSLFLVGGAVRDRLLGRPPIDVDLVASGPDAVSFSGRLAGRRGWTLVAAHAAFGTARLTAPGGGRVDVAVARSETYTRPGALPTVVLGATIADDLARRDFTIHAMAEPVGEGGELGPLIDPFGGRRDTTTGLLRLLHRGSLSDDPTRAIRAAQYGARFSFQVEERSFCEALAPSRASGAWRSISGDRLRRALSELLGEPAWYPGVGLLFDLGIPPLVEPSWTARPAAVPPADVPLDLRWRFVLSSQNGATRRAIADRLTFPRRLRLAAEVPSRGEGPRKRSQTSQGSQA